MIARLTCWWNDRHSNPQRHPLGGYRCADCGTAGASLDDMDPLGAGYDVPKLRRVFDRDRYEITQTSAWEEKGGQW